jgi:multidrug resistance efflux pump
MTDAGFATQAACDQAEAAVLGAEDGVRIAERNLASAESTAADDLAAARSRLAAARARLGDAARGATESQLEAARARVEQAEGALVQAEAQLDRAVMKAPFAAIVDRVHVAEGVQVAPGEPIVTLVKVRPLRFATSNLSERNLGLVQEGAEAVVTLISYPDQPLRATVQRVAAQATSATGGTTAFTVYLDVIEEEGVALRPGMTGRVEIDATR